MNEGVQFNRCGEIDGSRAAEGGGGGGVFKKIGSVEFSSSVDVLTSTGVSRITVYISSVVEVFSSNTQ